MESDAAVPAVTQVGTVFPTVDTSLTADSREPAYEEAEDR
jgi:hypothetical protein